MLPGFRFLLAAIVLSTSILIFGLGAAALLRAAHEQFAANPYWRANPEAALLQSAEAARPLLALLRVEPMRNEQKPDEPAVNASAIAAEAPMSAESAPDTPVQSLRSEQVSLSVALTQEDVAAVDPEQTSAPDIARTVANFGPQSSAAANPVETFAADPAAGAAPNSASEAKTESAAQFDQISSDPVAEKIRVASTKPDPAALSQASAPSSAQTAPAGGKIVRLDSPSVTVDSKPQAKPAAAKPDRAAINKRLRARRAAAQRRRLAAARARQLQAPGQAQVQPQVQPAIDPIPQLYNQPPAVAQSR